MASIPLPALAVKPPEAPASPLDTYRAMMGIQAARQESQLRNQSIQSNQVQIDDKRNMSKAYMDAIDPNTGKVDNDKVLSNAIKYKVSPSGIQTYQQHVADLQQKASTLDAATRQKAKDSATAIGQVAQATLNAPSEKKADTYRQGVQGLINDGRIQQGAVDPNTLPNDDDLRFHAASSMLVEHQLDELQKQTEASIKQPGEKADAEQKQRSNAATKLASATDPQTYQSLWGELPAKVAEAFPKPSEWTPQSKQQILQSGMTPHEQSTTPAEIQAARAWLAKPENAGKTMDDWRQYDKTTPQRFTMSGGGMIPPVNGNPPLPVVPPANASAPPPAAGGNGGNIPVAQMDFPVRTPTVGQPGPVPGTTVGPNDVQGRPTLIPDAAHTLKPGEQPPPIVQPGMTSAVDNTHFDPTNVKTYVAPPKDSTNIDPFSAKGYFDKVSDPRLAIVPGNIRGSVKQILDYRGPMPPQGRNNPTNIAVNYWVNKIDPSYDSVNYPARAALMKKMTSGTEADQLDAINTAMGHAGQLAYAVSALKNNDTNVLNKIANWYHLQVGDTPVSTYQTIVHRLAPEVASAYVKGGGSATERVADEKDFNDSRSPQQLYGALGTTIGLLNSKIGSMEQRYKTTMMKDDFRQRFITPEAQAMLAKWAPPAGTTQNPQTNQPVAKPKSSTDIKKRDDDLGVVYK